jgi:Uma2 family endonuclease
MRAKVLVMPTTARLITADELLRMPDDDYRYELVKGRLIRMPPPKYEHGRIVTGIAALLHAHVKANALGDVISESGYKLESDPDTVRAPDLSFVRRERTIRGARAYFEGGPDLVVDVLSPDDRPSAVREKIDEYLTHGVLGVLLVDPRRKTVAVHRLSRPVQTLREADILDISDIVDGFTCRVREIFE